MKLHGPVGNEGLISRIFSKISQNFGKALKIQVKLILNCPEVLEITCLSHVGQNV